MPDTVRQAPISSDQHRKRCDSGSCCSSPAVSPSHSFKRSRSTFYLLDRRTSPPPGRLVQLQSQNVDRVVSTVNGYVAFAWIVLRSFLGLPWINGLLVRVPSLWLCLCVRMAWACIRVPLVVSKRVLRLLSTARHAAGCKSERRTVLINGGSTVQTLHLARNFYLSGARVIVCEIEGRTELSSFSVAVDNHYTVPKPNEDNCVQYVDALRAIVEKERVGYYVPTGTTVSSYYDAVAKSHLELLGCKCCTPGLDGITVLNDLSEVFRKCEAERLPVPKHLRVCSKEDIVKLYDNVLFRADRHFIVNVGLSGCKTDHRLQLPAIRKSLTLPGPVSDDCPWLLVQNCPGSYYTTCTTLQNGKVLGNVTCSVRDRRVTRNDLVDDWLTHFVASLGIVSDGILTFLVCVTPSRNVIPMGCRIGVPVTYTSYRSNIERILYPPCAHETLTPEIVITDRYYAYALLYKTVTEFTTAIHSAKTFVTTLVTKHEMVFTYWDPLPCLAYYNIQMITDYIYHLLDKTTLSGQKNKYTTF